jgi:hypothetical protein
MYRVHGKSPLTIVHRIISPGQGFVNSKGTLYKVAEKVLFIKKCHAELVSASKKISMLRDPEINSG